MRRVYVCAAIAAMLLTACGGAARAPDPAAGQALYTGAVKIANGGAPNCSGCHPVNAGEPDSIGPNLSNIGNRAATTVPGQSAEDYLRAAIIDPDAYLAQGYQEGIHFRGYKSVLTTQQVNDLIAYLLTLRSGQD